MYTDNDGKIYNHELNQIESVVCDFTISLRTNTTQPLTNIISQLYRQKILLVTRTNFRNSRQK